MWRAQVWDGKRLVYLGGFLSIREAESCCKKAVENILQEAELLDKFAEMNPTGKELGTLKKTAKANAKAAAPRPTSAKLKPKTKKLQTKKKMKARAPCPLPLLPASETTATPARRMAKPMNHAAASANGNINAKQGSTAAADDQHEEVLKALMPQGMPW